MRAHAPAARIGKLTRPPVKFPPARSGRNIGVTATSARRLRECSGHCCFHHLQRACPLWVISGLMQCKTACPLYPRKRTCAVQLGMSAKCQKRTSTVQNFFTELPTAFIVSQTNPTRRGQRQRVGVRLAAKQTRTGPHTTNDFCKTEKRCGCRSYWCTISLIDPSGLTTYPAAST